MCWGHIYHSLGILSQAFNYSDITLWNIPPHSICILGGRVSRTCCQTGITLPPKECIPKVVVMRVMTAHKLTLPYKHMYKDRNRSQYVQTLDAAVGAHSIYRMGLLQLLSHIASTTTQLCTLPLLPMLTTCTVQQTV